MEHDTQIVSGVSELSGRVRQAALDTLHLNVTTWRTRANELTGARRGSTAAIPRTWVAQLEVIASNPGAVEAGFGIVVLLALIAFVAALSSLGGGET